MPPKVFQPNQFQEEIKQLLRDGVSVEECIKRYPPPMVSEKSIRRYKKAVDVEQAGGAVDGSTGVTKVVTKPQPLAVVTTKTPAPIVFRMGDLQIDLNPEHLYDTFRYCQDIKRMDPTLDEDFTLMIRGAVEYAWDVVSHREAHKIGVNLELVKEVEK